jgi:hypothetical protein
MAKSKNDIAWEKLFEKYQILDKVVSEAYFEIHSAQINEFRESRLMTKFDHRSQLPELFAKHGLSILPLSRGSYVISTFKTFHEFNTNVVSIQRAAFPENIESIDYNNITSEAAALNCAFVTGILANFLEDDTIRPTVSGRMSSNSFEFNVNLKQGFHKVAVINAQIEIDGGFEGKDFLCLLEAKNSLSKDFLVRQLYYPYRLWAGKINKKVRPVFLTYTNGIFHFREYIFRDLEDYSSVKLLREKRFVIQAGIINKAFIDSLLNDLKTIEEPKVPFPQADSFERLINLCELLLEKDKRSREFITANYDFDVRQTNYYTTAAMYLGLIKKEIIAGEVFYFLTSLGKETFELSIAERQKQFIRLILSHTVFKQVLLKHLAKEKASKKEVVVSLMKASNLYHIDSDSTYARRASTVTSWVNWILNQIEN